MLPPPRLPDAATGEGTGFTVQLGPNPRTLDPALNAAVDGGNTLITIEEPLLIIDENNEIQPGQAESCEVSDDWSSAPGPSTCATA